MNIIDIILIIFILVELYIGYRRGLLKMLINILGYIATIVLTYFLYLPFKEILVNVVGLDKIINDFITKHLRQLGAGGVGEIVSSTDLSAMKKMVIPDKVKFTLEKYLTTDSINIKDSIANNLTGGVANTVFSTVTDFLLTIIAIVVLFLILLIIIKIISSGANIIKKIPVISTVNALAGSFIALIKTYIILSIAALITVIILMLNNWQSFSDLIKQSFIADMMINHNIFIWLLFST